MTKGPAATSRPFVNEYLGHNQQHFAYTTKAGDVWDAYSCPECDGDKWRLQKITTGGAVEGVTSGPPAYYTLSPSVDVYAGHDQQHFDYVPAAGAIWDALWCPECGNGEWKLQQLAGP
jgi:rubredoxin